MKTENVTPENAKATEGREENRRANWQTGASAAVGVAAGIVGGNIVQSAMAADIPQDETAPSPAPQQTHGVQPEQETNPNPVDFASVEPIPTDPETASPHVVESAPAEPGSTIEVEVLSYETITAEDGTLVDVATTTINGQEVYIADLDHDHIADVMIADINGDGIITGNEIVDIRQENLEMDMLAEAVTPHADPLGEMVADLPDYTNDGDITGYMA